MGRMACAEVLDLEAFRALLLPGIVIGVSL